MIEERLVATWGKGSAHIVVPEKMIGQYVWVVSKEDAISLKELIERTLLLRNIDRIESRDFSDKFNAFQRDMCYRLTRLENVVYGTDQKAKE